MLKVLVNYLIEVHKLNCEYSKICLLGQLDQRADYNFCCVKNKLMARQIDVGINKILMILVLRIKNE